MRVWLTVALVLVSVMHVGCIVERKITSPTNGSTPSGDGANGASKPVVSGLRLGVDALGTVLNSGIQLPDISRDGQWIAYLMAERRSHATFESALTGENLDNVSLALAPVQRLGQRRVVVQRGACWPAFSPDGAQLVAVRYGSDGGAQLIVHDIAEAQTRRVDLPWAHALMPRVSPSGERVAIVGYDNELADARLRIINLADGRVLAEAPLNDAEGWQIAPFWLDDNTLVYAQSAASGVALHRWRTGVPAAEPLGALNVQPASPRGVVQALAGIGQALAPQRDRLVYYSAAQDRLIVQPLSASASHALAPRTRAGTWVASDLLAVARDEELLLVTADGSETHHVTESGRALPRWGRRQMNEPNRPIELLVPTAADTPWQLQLVRYRVQLGTPTAHAAN